MASPDKMLDDIRTMTPVLRGIFKGHDPLVISSAVWGATNNVVKWYIYDCVKTLWTRPPKKKRKKGNKVK